MADPEAPSAPSPGARGFLAGGAVQRVDVGLRAVLLRVRLPGETWFVIAATGRRGGVGVLAGKPWKGAGLPGGLAPDGEKVRLRGRLEGARVTAIGERHVRVDCGGAGLVLEAPAEEGARVTLRELPNTPPDAPEATREALEAAGARLEAALGAGALEGRKQDLARALSRASARVTRRIEAIRGDLGRIGEADGLAARATLLVAEASRAPRGATRLVATDWSTGEPRPVELPLDPARPAREQVDALFKRARRLKQGAIIAGQRLREAEQADAALDAARARLAAAETPEAIETLATEARLAAPRDFAFASRAAATAGKHRDAEPALPYRTFRAPSGARILVGRGAARNDALTFHVARPHDLWLHAKGHAGAHVVVPLDKNRDCPSDLLVDAAHLAAHFSEARGEGTVEIPHTPRRHVRKPRGSAPGLVVVDREKVTVLRVEADRVARLLAAEEV